MSAIMTLCADMKEVLKARPALAGIPVEIDRQKDLASMIAIAVGKAGACIVLYPTRLARAENPQPGDAYQAGIEIEVYAQPVLRAPTATAADDLIEDVIAALDGYLPVAAVGRTMQDRVVVLEQQLVPDQEYLVWRVSTRTRIFV